ncbi:hypothetical protein [Methylobacterium durans]|uniref:Uncharacterized protein n=1 Tax=Methylobacterium durans TaxID=2202825 RepID=A0A2U8WAR7_9HYPH|nr:hypothetical protein [Methylobacterium durans]AWN42708.1 hypothetical protein DK389_22125 [Methylobacterium durans]
MAGKDHGLSHTFIIYDPPAPGMPWISICVGPNRKISLSETFGTLAAAQARMAECVDVFVEGARNGHGFRLWKVRPTYPSV